MSKEKEAIARSPVNGASITRIIEYAPPFTSIGGGGVGVPFRDCVAYGVTYTKGSIIKGEDGHEYECTGDAKGSWKKV